MTDADNHIDRLTVAGWGALLMPLLTMWHEVGGHAVVCAVQGGRVAAIGAFYVACEGLARWPQIAVACAGVVANAALALVAARMWRHARSDGARLGWWLVWVSEAFVASGYFLFSGVTGAGDLGTGPGGELASLPFSGVLRPTEIVVGAASYIVLVRAAIRALTAMVGAGPATKTARRSIAHTYYLTCGVAAVIVGLLNPEGLFITIMSAAASSFGGLAGFITIGFAVPRGTGEAPFLIARQPMLVIAGAVVLASFAVVLGPTLRF